MMENCHVTEVANKWRDNGHSTEVANLMGGESSFYGGGNFNGGSMIMLQKCSL